MTDLCNHCIIKEQDISKCGVDGSFCNIPWSWYVGQLKADHKAETEAKDGQVMDMTAGRDSWYDAAHAYMRERDELLKDKSTLTAERDRLWEVLRIMTHYAQCALD